MKKITHTLLLVTDLVGRKICSQAFLSRALHTSLLKNMVCAGAFTMLSIIATQAQNVNIPDANFKAYLVGNTAINTNGDSEIQVSEAAAFDGLIDCNFLNISDLTGIEAFTSLTSLSCYSNQLTSLDVSNNTALTYLVCYSNQLTSLDVSNNTNLTWLNAGYNNITSFDVSANTALEYLYTNSNPISSLDISNNTALISLYCHNNQLTSLDVSNQPNLSILQCYSNDLTSLDISNNTQLTQLSCYNNMLTSLDVSNNTNLIKLFSQGNQLTALDISQNTALAELWCSNNNLNALDVSNNTALEYIRCQNNNLTTLDLSQNTALTQLQCGGNSITSLDVSLNTSLNILRCEFNDLTTLNVANGNNTNFLDFYAPNNSNLSCIQVDDAAYSTTNWTDIDAGVSFSEDCSAAWCTIDFPDANFKAYLIGNTSINTNGDGEIQCDEASSFSGSIIVSHLSISDLTGIEEFTALTSLQAFNNELTTVDISNNTALTHLALTNNQLTSLDVSNNTALIQLQIKNNQLNALDVSTNTALEYLDCATNQISQLDLTNNTALTYLECDKNELTNLDLTQNTALTELFCTENLLTQLNVANGNNGIITFFYTYLNPDLFCIQVDDASYSNSNWPDKDSWASYSEDCTSVLCTIDIPDANFKSYLVGNTSINTNGDGEIQCDEAEAFNGTINISNLSITDLTGIEAFINITGLLAANNSLSQVDVSFNTELVTLVLSDNDLQSIDLSNNSSLATVYIQRNANLSAVDITNLISLNDFDASNTLVSELDVSTNSTLTFVALNSTPISTLDFSSNNDLQSISLTSTSLEYLDLRNGANSSISTLNLTNNPALTCISVDDVAYAEANFNNIDATANFSTDCNNTANDILTFSFTEQAIDAVIDDVNHTVVIDVVSGTDISDLTPTFTVSTGASADPASGVTQDFSSDFVYTITAENPTAIQEWTVTVREVNTAPSDIALDNNAIDENNAADAVIGTFSTTDADASDSHTYYLVAGTGDADNASFYVSGSDLIALESFNFETKSSYSIRVQTDDGRGGTFEKEFIIIINDVDENSVPTDINLSASSLDENNVVDTVIGTFSTTDADASDNHTYALVAGTGDADNASFDVSGSDLIALESFDFETKSSYSIRVQTDDGRGGTFEKQFTISINDVEDRSEQTITFDPIEDQFLEAGSVEISATSSSGLEISFEIVSGPATVNGNVVSFSNLGTVVINASQPGDGEFLPAAPVEQSFEVISITSLNEKAVEVKEVRIFPNPTTDKITVRTQKSNVLIRLVNASGREIMQVIPNEEISLSHLNHGLYILLVSDNEHTSHYKIIKN